MSITTVGQHLIHYEALGRGEPLIFLHGWLGSWRYWWSSMQGMSRYYRTFAFDLWGFGDSSKPADQYQLDAYVEMLGAFIENLGIVRPVTLVGHGLGATIALRYAHQKGTRVKRLVTVSLPVHGRFINQRLINGNVDNFYQRMIGRSAGYPEVQQELRKTDATAIQQVTRQLLAADFGAEVETLSCPLLIVFGEQDPLVERPSGEYAHFQEPAGSRTFVTFQSCQHFPMLDEQAKFNRLILEFAHTENNDLANLSPKEYWQRRTY